jgi:hypothetical protein
MARWVTFESMSEEVESMVMTWFPSVSCIAIRVGPKRRQADIRNRIRGGFVSEASGGQQGSKAMYLGIGGLILLIIVLIILFR